MSRPFTFKVADLTAIPAEPRRCKFIPNGTTTTVTLVDKEGITGGTLTVRYAQQGSTIYEPSNSNTIDLSDPSSIGVERSIVGSIELSLAGFTTDRDIDEISIVVNSY